MSSKFRGYRSGRNALVSPRIIVLTRRGPDLRPAWSGGAAKREASESNSPSRDSMLRRSCGTAGILAFGRGVWLHAEGRTDFGRNGTLEQADSDRRGDTSPSSPEALRRPRIDRRNREAVQLHLTGRKCCWTCFSLAASRATKVSYHKRYHGCTSQRSGRRGPRHDGARSR